MGHATRLLALILATGLCFGATLDSGSAVDEKRDFDEVAVRRAGERRPIHGDPFAHIMADRLLDTLSDLTAIGDHNGWRHSTTRGEAKAIAWVKGRLDRMRFLRALGLEFERQHFICRSEAIGSRCPPMPQPGTVIE
jgi:hypothetical protein